MSKPNDRLYTLNLTVVALVALVAIVGVTAIVLHGKGALTPAEPQLQTAGQVGEAFARGGYLGPPVQQPPADDYCKLCLAKCQPSPTATSAGSGGTMPPVSDVCSTCLQKCGSTDDTGTTGTGAGMGGPARMIRDTDDCSDCLQFASCAQCKSSSLCSSC